MRHERRIRSCAGDPVFNFYSIEVVQRIGYDSFTPDNGVLIAKNKNAESRSCGYNCFTWVIDAHPEDIKLVRTSRRPDGTRRHADGRRLPAAERRAVSCRPATRAASYEWKDEPNRLHFYVIDREARRCDGILSYTVAVRSLDGAGASAARRPGRMAEAATRRTGSETSW